MNSTGQLTVALVMATPGTSWGGMEKHTADLAEAFAERGHQVHILAHPAYQGRFPESVHRHTLPFGLGRRNPWLRYSLRRTLASIQPDILHAQGSKAASLVRTVHRTTAITLGTVHGTKTSHQAFSKLDGVIGVSHDIVAGLAHPEKRLIHNGLRRSADLRNKTAKPDIPIPEERPLLIAAGRLEPVKQFDRLIRAWASMDRGGKLVILGEGSQRKRLESLICELGAESRISVPGHESQVQPWLDAANACLISSSREGFPYIMVEALMTGCPVLTTPVSGVKDFLPDDAIAASDSVEDLAALIDASLCRPDNLRDFQSSSFERARAQLDLETMVSQTESFYHHLLAKRTLAGPITDGRHD